MSFPEDGVFVTSPTPDAVTWAQREWAPASVQQPFSYLQGYALRDKGSLKRTNMSPYTCEGNHHVRLSGRVSETDAFSTGCSKKYDISYMALRKAETAFLLSFAELSGLTRKRLFSFFTTILFSL